MRQFPSRGACVRTQGPVARDSSGTPPFAVIHVLMTVAVTSTYMRLRVHVMMHVNTRRSRLGSGSAFPSVFRS